jgi:hypothetical protein
MRFAWREVAFFINFRNILIEVGVPEDKICTKNMLSCNDGIQFPRNTIASRCDGS